MCVSSISDQDIASQQAQFANQPRRPLRVQPSWVYRNEHILENIDSRIKNLKRLNESINVQLYSSSSAANCQKNEKDYA